MKKTIFFLLCFLTFIPKIFAYDAVTVMDADGGRVLFSQNGETKHLIASTTKIMTALVVLNYGNIKDEVTVGDEVLEAYGSSIYIKPGEKLTVEDLLYGLMLRSGNDAALVLAKHIAGSTEGFVKLMNDTALGLGMHDTVFSNPHGLDEETENKSTTTDMCLLMVEAMKNEQFKKITGTKKYSVKTNFGAYEWINKNRLISDYKYATGGKIGYTTRAKHTFVSSATKDNKNIVIATFVDRNKFDTHKALYEKYFDMYKNYELINKDHPKIDYKRGYKVYTTSSFSMLLTKEEKKKIKREVELYDIKGDYQGSRVIGTISVMLDGKEIKKMNIYAKAPKIEEKKSIIDKIKEFFKW